MSSILSVATPKEVHNGILVSPDFHLHKEHCILIYHIFVVLIGPYIAIFYQIPYEIFTDGPIIDHGP